MSTWRRVAIGGLMVMGLAALLKLSLSLFVHQPVDGGVAVGDAHPVQLQDRHPPAESGWYPWVPGVPGVEFSAPLGGLAIGLRGPDKIAARRFREGVFEVYIVNSGSTRSIAFCKHGALVQLLVYDPQGRLITGPWGYNVRWTSTTIADLEVLHPGELLRILLTPFFIPQRTFKPGRYRVEAILVPPAKDQWPVSLGQMLKNYNVPTWGPAEIRSPRIAVELY